MKNVDIYINGSRVFTDNKTKIGTTIRNFDITDPSNRKQPFTNTILLPVKPNDTIFKFASQPGYQGTLPYDRLDVSIVVDGYHIITNGIGYIQEVKDGYYYVNIREQPDIIQTMQDKTLASVYSGYTSTLGAIAGGVWIQTMKNATSNIRFDFIINETQKQYMLANTRARMDLANTNYTCYIKDIFTRAASQMGITFAGSLLSDSYFQTLRMVVAKAYFVQTGTSVQIRDVVLNEKKSFFDLFKAVLQVFGAVYRISGTTITIEKYDDITVSSVNWEGKLHKAGPKKFSIPNFAQNNYMRFKKGGAAEETLNEAVWTCANKNIANQAVIIEPDVTVYDRYNLFSVFSFGAIDIDYIAVPEASFTLDTSGAYPYTLDITSTINELAFVIDSGFSDLIIPIDADYVDLAGVVQLSSFIMAVTDDGNVATYYNSQNDYTKMAALIDKPVMYEVEMNLDALDLHDYDEFVNKRIPELGGDFYANSFQYNFAQGGKGSKLTLIKVP
jgi:hypothetical protein